MNPPTNFYYLKDKIPTKATTWEEVGLNNKEENKRVAKTVLPEGVWVSTVFLMLDHSFGDGPPLFFETMIFGGVHDEYQERCSTWDEALEMHKRAVELATRTEDK